MLIVKQTIENYRKKNDLYIKKSNCWLLFFIGVRLEKLFRCPFYKFKNNISFFEECQFISIQSGLQRAGKKPCK